mmetsp:Transcript_57817/g.106846  ORF Transcript_57817/g.106846 Transcript_57817/m.106846 type:complete len:119 (+) Transcript_57817:252-608(+)
MQWLAFSCNDVPEGVQDVQVSFSGMSKGRPEQKSPTLCGSEQQRMVGTLNAQRLWIQILRVCDCKRHNQLRNEGAPNRITSAPYMDTVSQPCSLVWLLMSGRDGAWDCNVFHGPVVVN